MLISRIILGRLIIATVFASGCSSATDTTDTSAIDSMLICELGKQCKYASDEQKNVQCFDQAVKEATVAAKLGCVNEYSNAVSCFADLDDICTFTGGSECRVEASAYALCQQRYCSGHPGDKDCG